MVRKIRTSLSSLLSDAQERGLVSRNVVRELRHVRKRGKERRAERRQQGKLKVGVDIPTREEVKAIVEAAEGRWRPLLLTAIFTGLRASELRGLRWEDVDLAKRELHVRQRADRYLAIGTPKSESGERAVPLPPIVAQHFARMEARLSKNRSGSRLSEQMRARPTSATIVTRGLAPTLIAAGVTVAGTDKHGAPIVRAKYTGLHSLRHFYASWCINRRADGGLELPGKVVQERLGHSGISITMDVYGHLFPRGDDAAELAAAEKSLLG